MNYKQLTSPKLAPFIVFCVSLKKVAINNSLNLGEHKGFGEWVFFQAPNNYQVTVLLLPLRDWNAIGPFEKGVISLQLGEDDLMELRGADIGPSSLNRAALSQSTAIFKSSERTMYRQA